MTFLDIDPATLDVGIDSSIFDTIYQTTNPSYFKQNTDERKKQNIVAMIADAMDHTQCMLAPDFEEDLPPIKSFAIKANEDRSLACHFTYQAGDQVRSVFFIGEFRSDKPDGPFTRVAPFLIQQGIILKPHDMDEDVYFLAHAVCRIFQGKHSNLALASTDNGHDTPQIFCYGREGLELILTNQRLSVAAMQQWIAPNQSTGNDHSVHTRDDQLQGEDILNRSILQYNQMAFATADEFHQTLALRARLSSADVFIAQAPPSLS